MTGRSDPFAPFVARLAARWADGSSPWQEIDGTLVFADVSGFTALSERLAKRGKLGAEQMTDLLDAIFERLLGAAFRRGGDLLAFGGDALCLLFDGPDHPARGVAAAAEMQRALRVRTPAHQAVGRISLGMSIGCHRGPVRLARVGGQYHQLLAFGDTVTATLRLEGAAERGEVLVSDALAAALPAGAVGPPDRGGRLLRQAPDPALTAEADLTVATAGRGDEFVSPRIRPELLSGAAAAHRMATIAFVKAEGTDALGRAEPATAPAELDALVSQLQEIADRYDVTLLDPDVYPDAIKFLVAAGVPTATPDDTDRMLEAAREMVRVDSALMLRAGVNGGRVFAGPVGGPTRRSYTVIGDTVNLAARLMAHAPERSVLATEALLDRARTHFVRTSLPPFPVKGKSEPVRAATVGEPTAGSHWDRTDLPPIVGRDRERRILMDAWAQADDGSTVIELVGEPGIGKSRLVIELTAQVEMHRFVAEGGVYAATSPYRALIPPLFRIVGIEETDTEAEQGRRLVDYVSQTTPALVPWLPLLAIAFGIELPPTPETADLAPEFRRARLAEVFVEFLAAVLPGRLLILVEDAHWLDEPSQELLTAVARSSGPRPWLVVLTRRPVAGGLALPEDIPVTRLVLQPLPSDAAERLARAALQGTALPAQTIDALVARAGGNPFFLTELMEAARAGGDVEALPESMESLIAAAIDTLDPADRQVLRQASVLGREFPARVLAELADTARLEPVLRRLQRFLERDEDRVRFRHALLRQTAYEGLPFRTRAALHLRAAQRFEQDAGVADEEAELLSLHFFHGRRFDKALHYSRVAGDRAQDDLAPVEAAVFYRRALDAARVLGAVTTAERARLEESLADVSERASHYELAREALRRARRLVGPDAVARARLLQKDGWIEQRLGRLPQALALYTRALGLVADRTEPAAAVLRADLRVARAGIRQRQGRWDESITILRGELPQLRGASSVAARARANFLLYSALSARGDRDGLVHAHDAIALFEQCGDLYGQSGVYNNIGVEAYYLGNWAEALEHYGRARELAERIGDVVEAATTMVNLGEILSDQGVFADAEEAFVSALEVFRGARYVFGIAYASSDLARLKVRTGAVHEAHALFDVAREHFEAMGAGVDVLETDGRRVEALLVEGRSQEALDLGTVALQAIRDERDETLLEAWLERLVGAAHLRLGDLDAARAHWETSLVRAADAGADFERAQTLECLAHLDQRSSPEAAAMLAQLGVRATATDLLLDGRRAVLTTSP